MRRYEYRECVSLMTQFGFWEVECWVKRCLGKDTGKTSGKNEGKHKNVLIWPVILAPLTFTFAWQLDCPGFTSEI